MADTADERNVRQQVLQKTLEEVQTEEKDGESNDPCVICLDLITEPCVAIPCNHSNFDYLCLLTWLEQGPFCPLCKIETVAVKYDLNAPKGFKTYKVPAREKPGMKPGAFSRTSVQQRALAGGLDIGDSRAQRRRSRPPNQRPPRLLPTNPVSVRYNVYRNQLFSLRVGSNRLSQYSEVTPEQFSRNESLISRARKWIRRELQVFTFLNPVVEDEQPAFGRRPHGNHAEFLLDYVISILRTIDIRGSSGQAEELLKDFLGRENARLFLHELLSWLRSPYDRLEDWDRNVQYPTTQAHRSRELREPLEIESNSHRRRARSPPPASRRRSASPIHTPDRSLFDRISRAEGSNTLTSTQVEVQPRTRVRPRARNRGYLDRYIPEY
ncbi:hypothetical protein N7532_001776 [Penicillium argentinense]|uniref:RING-type E3 ubiquitin transferase n=1 Tax=Penicillium argentinense TaxID=1131581 RepID=A0A9W9KMS2_9EURO|nr:uncharacterized protein N7532_001776 [Penicillium argentinense]KAJ5111241.1 hypothetical protein N7532_001776 [Penicillium argentinense]